jgi:hypothetical protein
VGYPTRSGRSVVQHPTASGKDSREIARTVIKSAIVGASCVGLPGLCPAITMLSTADDVAQLAARVVDSLQESGPPSRRLKSVGSVLAKATAEWAAEKALEPSTEQGIRTISDSIATELARSTPLGPPYVKTIVEGTLTGLIQGGISETISWALGDS